MKDLQHHLRHALLQLQRGSLSVYQHCTALLHRLDDESLSESDLLMISRINTLAPHDITSDSRLLQQLERLHSRPSPRAEIVAALGGARLRSDSPQQAVELLKKAVGNRSGAEGLRDRLLLAIAQHQASQVDDARKSLETALEALGRYSLDADRPRRSLPWPVMLELMQLRDEAVSLIGE